MYNGGEKISATKSLKIAKHMQKLIDDGSAEKYEKEYTKSLEEMEDIDCDICDGTGKRKEPPETGAGTLKCNGCEGTGKREPWVKSYPFSVENLQEFIEFSKNSGGFEIL